MRRLRPRALAALLALLPCLSARADVKLPAIIGDNMCLQAGLPAPVWGWASPDEKVTVSFGQQSASATAGKDGKWMAKLDALKAGETGELTVKGNNTLVLKNVIVGEVWVCSGQSNMEFGMQGAHNAKEEIAKANYPKVRLFTVQKKIAFEPQEDCVGKWAECTPETAKGFSAVGYFFGRDVHEALGTPVGLIHTSWGGTPAQAWTSRAALEVNPHLNAFAESLQNVLSHREQVKEKYEKETLPKFLEEEKKWRAEVEPAYKEKVKLWEAEAKAADLEHRPAPPKPQPAKAQPRRPGDPTNNPNLPSTLYNGMIAPLVPYAIQGCTWYQGESNAGQPDQYAILFPAMIENWRHDWAAKGGNGDFSFHFVQLANFMQRHPDPSDTGWARLREAQLKTLSLPKTGMAVIIDVGQGDDIHPKDKMDVGHRLALEALKVTYGKDVVPAGPLYDGQMKAEGNKVRLGFKNVGGGLKIGAAPSTQVSVPPQQPLGDLKGFAIAGDDHVFVWAQAKIEGDQVVVWSDKVEKPVAVRYGWDDNPFCNLYNKENLPASPFRTDDWPMAGATPKK